MSQEPLHDIRVLEVGRGVASAFAARMLADEGADVIKVEPPAGDDARQRGPFPGGQPDPEQSGLFLALNTNKRGVCLDLDSEDARAELHALLEQADILVHDYRNADAQALGLDAESLEAARPDLVTLCITPFGLTGPNAEFRAEELTISAAGGWANLSPAATLDPELPPLKVSGDQCALMTGLAGATAALAAHAAARRSGVGEFIDMSQQAYTASVLENAIPLYSYQERIATRYGNRELVPWKIFRCRDGFLFIACIEQDQWERLVDLMGRPDWATLEIFDTPRGRAENHDVLHGFVQEWLAERSVDETYHAMQAERICAAPVLTPARVAASPHLQARELFVDVEHEGGAQVRHLGPVVRTEAGRYEIRRGAPKQGASGTTFATERGPAAVRSADHADRPLRGIRVADLSWAWAGPFCAMNLAHLGAEVVRFESVTRLDLYRRLPVHPPDVERSHDTAGMFNQWHQGKYSVALNLQEPRGKEILRDFIATCDVVVENFATGVMERLGLGYETLSARNPGLVLASISGYGQTGPYARYMGYGPAIAPMTGLSASTGFVGGDPSEIGVSMPDPTAGITAALAVCAALEKRRRTGRGRHLDISLWEATAVLSLESWMDFAMNGTDPERQGNRDPRMAPHGFFRTQGDDEWISIACGSDSEWQALCAELAPELASDPRFATLAARKANEDALEAALAEPIGARERWALTHALQARGIAAYPALTPRDVMHEEHLEAQGFFERLPHEAVGVRTHTGIPYRLRQRPNGVHKASPPLGADTERILGEVLGYTPEQVGALREAKVLF